jgi:hypothetical protein
MKRIALYFLVPLVVYLSIVFISLEPNVFAWDGPVRALALHFSFAGWIVLWIAGPTK